MVPLASDADQIRHRHVGGGELLGVAALAVHPLDRGLVGALGDRRSYYLLEQFVPGEVFHVDSLVKDGEVIFAAASGYSRPPLYR